MFTGIIEILGTVVDLLDGKGLTVRAVDLAPKLHSGDSIAINGTCLTIVNCWTDSFSVEVVPETFRRTNLGDLGVGDKVNVETPLTMGADLGGHFVQGHVDGRGTIETIDAEGLSHVLTIGTDLSIMRYIVQKGFVAIDGISLTVVSESTNNFSVAIIPYTFAHTTLNYRSVGQTVNLEVDILAKYVERMVNKT